MTCPHVGKLPFKSRSLETYAIKTVWYRILTAKWKMHNPMSNELNVKNDVISLISLYSWPVFTDKHTHVLMAINGNAD